jgi:hypothetical protein
VHRRAILWRNKQLHMGNASAKARVHGISISISEVGPG